MLPILLFEIGYRGETVAWPAGIGLGLGIMGFCPVSDFTMAGLVLGFKPKVWTSFPFPSPNRRCLSSYYLELAEGWLGQLFPS
jgi:hypothetical protein